MIKSDLSRLWYTAPASLAILLLASATTARGQESTYDFFDDRSVLHFTVRTDLVELLGDRSQESQERPGEVQYETNGATVVVPVQVKTRGSFRLDPENCDFPPIRLNFRKTDVPRTLFEGQDQLKMVTHCATPDVEYQEFVVLEYLVYRVYETLTSRSFRTRLAEVRYEDASGTFGPVTRYAFLIENVVDLASRNNAKLVELDGFHALLADETETSLFDVFQYMIGNTDWSVPLSQNVEFLEDSTGNVSVVPFDFDWSGAVAPPYAVPAPDVPTETVRDRFFMGVCRTGDHLTDAFRRFVDAKESIFALYEGQEELTSESRTSVLQYYQQFYDTISDRRLADRHIRRACRL